MELHSVCLGASGGGVSTKIILLRHGEKPTDPSDEHLSSRGQSRAGALPAWLIGKYGKPVAIYGMRPGTKIHATFRPVETVQPLADACGLDVIQEYGYGQGKELAHEIITSYKSGVVVVAWIHAELQSIAKALGIKSAPEWNGDYDNIWEIDLSSTRLTKVPQRLLFGDSRK